MALTRLTGQHVLWKWTSSSTYMYGTPWIDAFGSFQPTQAIQLTNTLVEVWQDHWVILWYPSVPLIVLISVLIHWYFFAGMDEKMTVQSIVLWKRFIKLVKGLRMVVHALWRSEPRRIVPWSETLHEEHKTKYLVIHAKYIRIVVFWHISNMPP